MRSRFQQTYLRMNRILFSISLIAAMGLHAQFIPVGSGSYTTVFPGVDAAGRNGYPSGSAFVTGSAANKPIPTNDWWSASS